MHNYLTPKKNAEQKGLGGKGREVAKLELILEAAGTYAKDGVWSHR